MISGNNKVTSEKRVAALRGRMMSLTVLELFYSNLEELNQHLGEKAAQAPDFFANAPLLLDFSQLDGDVDIQWLESARKLVEKNNFSFVGIIGASEELEMVARARAITVWPSGKPSRQVVEPEISEVEPDKPKEDSTNNQEIVPPEPPPVQEMQLPQSENHAKTLVVRQPVRSGQKVYARGGDLIVLASVSTGAEILADGHIHVYGTLRGRAIAGAQGMNNARIFCQDLQADLVAIAGYYTINDDLPEDKRKTAVQIFLQKEELKIEEI